jgi:predicted Zn-dependent protease
MRAARIFLPLLIAILHTGCRTAKKLPAPGNKAITGADGAEVAISAAYINAEAQYLSASGDRGLAAFLSLEKEQPDNAAVHYRIACIYKAQEQYSEALFFIRKAHRLDEKNRWYRELEAALLEQTGEPAQAATIFEQLMAEDPTRSIFFQEAMRLQLKAGNRSRALELINRREQQVGLRPATTYRKILLLKAEGRYLDAADEMKKLGAKYPDRNAYKLREAELSMEAGNLDRAVPLLSSVLAQNPADFEVEALLLQIRLNRGETNNSFESLQRLTANPELGFSRKKNLLDLWQGRVHVSSDSIAQILHLLEQAHPEDPHVLEYCGDLATARGMDSLAAASYLRMLYEDSVFNKEAYFVDYQKTINALRLISDWNALFETASDMADLFPAMVPAHYWKAYGAFQLNSLETALESANYGLSMAFKMEDQLAVRALMLRIFCVQGKTDEALELARKSLQNWPKEPWAKAQLAYVMALTGETAAAEKMARDAAGLPGPDSAAVHIILGWVLFFADKPAEAIRVWEAVKAPEAHEPQVLEAIGDAYAKTGNKTQAKFYWQRALKAGGDAVKLKKKLNEP